MLDKCITGVKTLTDWLTTTETTMRIEINSRRTGAVLFAHEQESNSVRLTVEAAVRAGADLARAYLVGANLAGANLAGADLAGADLAGADLARAYLVGAHLVGADLARAYLVGANLAGANLAGANLAGADLADANLARADLAGAATVIDAGTPNGWRCVGWLRDGVVQVRVGCRSLSLAKGREYWHGKDDRREVVAALDYIEAVAKLRGWI